MTWNELIKRLQTMTAEQLASDVTVYVRGDDEFYPLSDTVPLAMAVGTVVDVLDENHPYLII